MYVISPNNRQISLFRDEMSEICRCYKLLVNKVFLRRIVNEIIGLHVVCDTHIAHEAPSGEYSYECVVHRINKFCELQRSLLPISKSRDIKTRTKIRPDKL